MKKSNWREEFDAPSAVKKTINEFVVTGGGVLAIAKNLGLGAALKTVVGTTTGKVAAGTVAGAAVGSATKGKKKKKKKKGEDGPLPHTFHVGTSVNPQ